MEKLYELHDESDFDLVVVDTPARRARLPRRPGGCRLPRAPAVPPAGGSQPRAGQGGQHGRPDVPAHRVEGGGRRRGRRRHRLLPGVRRHGGRVPRAGRPGERAVVGAGNGLRAGRLAPATRSARRTSSPSACRRRASRSRAWWSTRCTRRSAYRPQARVAARPDRPARPVRRARQGAGDRGGRRRHGDGPPRWPAPRSAASTATWPTSRRWRAASRPTWRAWPRRWRRRPSCGCRSCAVTSTTWSAWTRSRPVPSPLSLRGQHADSGPLRRGNGFHLAQPEAMGAARDLLPRPPANETYCLGRPGALGATRTREAGREQATRRAPWRRRRARRRPTRPSRSRARCGRTRWCAAGE